MSRRELESSAAAPDPTEDRLEPESASTAETRAGIDTETGLEPVPESGDEVARLRRERDDLREQLLRRRADFENYRRRVERDRHTAAQEALAALLLEVVTTVDNMDSALSVDSEASDLRQGVELTHRELLGLLESHGVVALDPLGEPFDPTVHQALLHEPAPGFAEGTVAEVFRKGYTFGERLLRPALVKVARADGPAEGGSDDDSVAQ